MFSAENLYQSSPRPVQTLLLNAYAWRVRHHRYGRHFKSALRQFRAHECWPPEQLKDFQDERIRRIVSHAYERSEYYRNVMNAAGITPDDIRGVDDLCRLPLLTKEDVKSNEQRLMTEVKPGRDWLNGHTSGTTGSPLSIWYDRITCSVNNAVDRRHKYWGGMPDGAWIGLFLGRVIVPLRQKRPPYWRADWMQRQLWFSSFHMSEATLRAYVREIERRHLRFLEGYPSTLYLLAKYLLRTGRTLSLQAAFSSSETLLPIQRSAIESAFRCPLYDFYGLAERVAFAGECEEHQGKHLAEDFGYVEVVDQEGNRVPDGQRGYLVGTSLHNTAMPMLRYRTGDMTAVLGGACPCGRTFRRIADVTTKAEDIVVTPDGRMVSPSILTHPFKPLDQILKSQIVQTARDRILVNIVASDEFTRDHEDTLRRALMERLGDEMEIDVQVVDEIPPERSGKFRWVISTVPHDYGLPWDGPAE